MAKQAIQMETTEAKLLRARYASVYSGETPIASASRNDRGFYAWKTRSTDGTPLRGFITSKVFAEWLEKNAYELLITG